MGRGARREAVSDAALSRWRLIVDFKKRLQDQLAQSAVAPTWEDPQRQLELSDYLSLFLLGLFNPVVRTMRGLCAASHLPRVQNEVCRRPVSLGSFSEAQAALDPQLLEKVFSALSTEVLAACPPASSGRNWLLSDSTLFEALPRMYWALWRRQGNEQAQVRLQLSLELTTQSPARASIGAGKVSEVKLWRGQWRPGDAYVGDRGFGQDYQLFAELNEKGIPFVVRLRDSATINTEKELPVSEEDAKAGVTRATWASLGCRQRYESIALRVVWVQTPKEMLLLATNLEPAALTAGEVALLYKERWKIELFFRWIKCILGCRHWLAQSPEGAALQIYLALIAALLLQLYTGQRPNRRLMELLQFYAMGMASMEDVMAGLERQRTARRKKQ